MDEQFKGERIIKFGGKTYRVRSADGDYLDTLDVKVSKRGAKDADTILRAVDPTGPTAVMLQNKVIGFGLLIREAR